MSLRRSERLRTKGKGDQTCEQIQQSQNETEIRENNSISSRKCASIPYSKLKNSRKSSEAKVSSVTSSKHRQILQEKIETAKKLHAIEEAREKRERELLDLELALKLANISNGSVCTSSIASENLIEIPSSACSQRSRIQEWVNKQESEFDVQDCQADNHNSDTVRSLVSTMQTLNQEDHLKNPILLQDLIRKLPMRYRVEWARKCKDLDQMKEQWKIENMNIKMRKSFITSKEDQRAQEIMNATIRKVEENRFETGLLWKEDDIVLPESRTMAMKRLKYLENRMDRDSTFADAYCEKMEEYVRKNYVKKIGGEETNDRNPKTWYLPHFGVKNPNKPNKARVREEDKCAQRFLWRGKNRTREPDVYEIQVVFFGAKCSPSLAQEVKNRNALDHADKFSEAAHEIMKKHYMDDYLGGTDDEEKAIKLVNEVIKVHSNGGFIICNWISNNQRVLESIDSDLIANQCKILKLDCDNDSERILGLWWNPKSDVFTFESKFHKVDPDILNLKQRPTKRELLRVVMSLFDPLGFIGNFTIHGKILLQDIWRVQIGWDDEIPDSLKSRWDLSNNSTREIHIFCDSSENAYAAVAYLRQNDGNNVNMSFLYSKCKVAPLKQLSIPRLELQAALMGARIGNFLKSEIDIAIKKVFYWSDSKTVLHWIASESRRYKVYVAHRVGEIQELTESSNWLYVPSNENVADEATKRVHEIDFSESSRWLKGPSFLWEPTWTSISDTNHNYDDSHEDYELRNEFVAVISKFESGKLSEALPDPKRFSKWNKLLRCTAWILRFLRNSRMTKKLKTELLPAEIEEASLLLFRRVQQEKFSEELFQLHSGKALPKSSKLYKCNCILEGEIIRLGGRLENSLLLNEFTKRPILLDSKHEITKLLIQNEHEKVNHHGKETVINNLRQKFWILGLRQGVQRAWRSCYRCKIRNGKPNIPLMGQLPSCRLEPTSRPFIKTGVDYFGPILVTVKRSHEKRYGVIFTCMATRAVHIEIAHDLSTEGFLHVYRQFGCRRGFPLQIFSDNGSNFKGAERELREKLAELNQDEIIRSCTSRNTLWHFCPPLSPNMGGTWERLIQSIKKSLKEVLTQKFPPEYTLRTLFIEIENIINSRPLTHVSLDHEDAEALTPNHFLIGPDYLASTPMKTTSGDICLLSKWRAAQRLSDLFWKRWLQEYLPTLVRRDKWLSNRENVKVGSVVLIADPDSPRNSWPRGKIEAVYPGRDSIVRVVDVKTSSGILRRPVSKICVLDIAEKSN